MSAISPEKHLRLIQALIRTSDYSHPIFLATCKELNINPEDLKPKKLEDFADKKTCIEIHELRFKHYEIKRKAKMEEVATKIMKSGTNILKLINKDLGPIHFQRYSLSEERTEPTMKPKTLDTTTIPLTRRDLSQQKLKFQKKKLERILRVMGNIKELKYQEEVKRVHLKIENEKKSKKIAEDKINSEEKRIEKIMKANAKREEKLRKRNDVLGM